MSRIKGGDTNPEKIVRSALHGMGYRFRLHRRDLPGKPDVVLPKFRAIFLVHGCFWHRHRGCKYAYEPKSRRGFWQGKFARNVERDQEVYRALKNLGWQVFIVWECQTRSLEQLCNRLKKFMGRCLPPS
jgi:DNA mismatch endonuclease (patch repair protein)